MANNGRIMRDSVFLAFGAAAGGAALPLSEKYFDVDSNGAPRRWTFFGLSGAWSKPSVILTVGGGLLSIILGVTALLGKFRFIPAGVAVPAIAFGGAAFASGLAAGFRGGTGAQSARPMYAQPRYTPPATGRQYVPQSVPRPTVRSGATGGMRSSLSI